MKAQLDACPQNGSITSTNYTGPYLEEADLPGAETLVRPAYPGDDGPNYVFVDPDDLVQGAVHYFECPAAGGYVVFDSGIELARMVLISECGFAFCGPKELSNFTGDPETLNPVLCRTTQTGPNAVQNPYLHDVVLLAEGTHKNTIFARFGLRAGAPDDCAPGGGVLMVSNGSMRVHGYYDMHDVQAIAPDDIHWHQIVKSWGGVTIAGKKIHAMRNWLSEYVGCPTGADLFLSTGARALRLVR